MNDFYLHCLENLKTFYDKTKAIYCQAPREPIKGSKADRELSIPQGKNIIETTFSLSEMMIESSADELFACYKLLSNPAQTIAPWTCARALLESSALGCWLMDLQIDHFDRMRRCYAFRYSALYQQKLFFQAVRKDKNQVDERIEKVEKEALSFGFSPLRNKKGKRSGIGMNMLSMTDLVKQFLNQEAFYRLCSAVLHADSWALMNTSFKAIDTEIIRKEFPISNRKNGAFLSKNLSPENYAIIIFENICAHAHNIWSRFNLFGFNIDSLKEVIIQSYNNSPMKCESMRFWES